MEFDMGILAGGKSERFGSNKAIFKIDEYSLISRILLDIPNLILKPKIIFISLFDNEQLQETIGAIKNDLQLSKSGELEWELCYSEKNSLKKIPLKFVFDQKKKDNKDIRAAIFGIYAIFQEISEGIVQIVPCDTPFFKAKHIDVLFSMG